MTKSRVTGAGATLTAFAAAVGIAAVCASPAQAAVCGDRAKMTKVLADRYQERTRGLGVVSETGIVELYISKAGTWSILLTSISGSSCIIAAGHDWEHVVPEPDGPEA